MKTAMFVSGVFLLLILSHTAVATVADAVVTAPEPISLATVGVAMASLASYKIYRKHG
jgi:hypothetical protein